MTFVYFPCEFYRISNAIAYKTLILNYNSEFNLGICFFSFTYLDYDFSNLILYIFNLKKKLGVNALLVPTFCIFSILVPTFYFYHF